MSGRRAAGTVAVGVVVSGVATYGFLVLAARGLGTEAYAPFAVGWSVALVIAAGLFAPLEQETARRVALAQAEGRPVAGQLGSTAAVSGGVALATGLALVVVGPWVSPLLVRGGPVWWALLAVTAAYAVQLPVRGFLSGSRAFGRYGAVLGVEGVVRTVLAGGLVLAGYAAPGAYVALIAVGALLSVLVAHRGRSGRRVRRPGLPRGEDVRSAAGAVLLLVLGTLAAQVLLNVGPVLVTRLAEPGEADAASRLLAGMSLVRVPLFMFTAVQATLIPRLTADTASGDVVGFRRALLRLLSVIAVVTVVSAGASLVAGEAVVRLLFGAGFELSGPDLAVLAVGVGAYLVALSMAAALVALGRHGAVLRGWAVGLVGLAVVTALVPGLLLRVELGFGVGSACAAAWLVVEVLRARRRSGRVGR